MMRTTNPFHVCLLTEATAGGARKHVRYLVQGLHEAGVRVSLIYSHARSDCDFSEDLQDFEERGVRVYEVPMTRGPGPKDISAYSRIKGVLTSERPDVIHTHCAKAGLLGRLAAKALSPAIVTVHTPHSYFFEGLENGLAKTMGIRLERWLGRRTDRQICVSEAERHLALNHSLIDPNAVTVIRNGIPEPGVRQSREEIRAELGLAENEWAIGMPSRLAEQKNHALLLAAVPKLPDDVRARLRIFCWGDGPMGQALAAQAKRLGVDQTVRFPGYTPGAERFLPGMDAGILTSHYEGLPYQLLESLAAGLPLIATDIPGNRPQLPDNPICYTAAEPAAVAAAIANVLGDEDERKRRGEAGRQWIDRHFRLSQQIEQVIACYQETMKG